MLLSEEAHMSRGALAVNISFHCNCAPNPPPALHHNARNTPTVANAHEQLSK